MLMDLLIDDGRTVGAVTILPAPDESVKSHINSYECFTELEGISGSGACFIIDNEKGDKLELNTMFVDKKSYPLSLSILLRQQYYRNHQ